jgi:hypothetical protein
MHKDKGHLLIVVQETHEIAGHLCLSPTWYGSKGLHVRGDRAGYGWATAGT